MGLHGSGTNTDQDLFVPASLCLGALVTGDTWGRVITCLIRGSLIVSRIKQWEMVGKWAVKMARIEKIKQVSPAQLLNASCKYFHLLRNEPVFSHDLRV